MSAITTLRGAVRDVSNEVEARVTGVLEASEGAVLAFVSVVEVSVRQVVRVFFGFANIVVTEGFNVAEAVTTAVLGAVEEVD